MTPGSTFRVRGSWLINCPSICTNCTGQQQCSVHSTAIWHSPSLVARHPALRWHQCCCKIAASFNARHCGSQGGPAQCLHWLCFTDGSIRASSRDRYNVWSCHYSKAASRPVTAQANRQQKLSAAVTPLHGWPHACQVTRSWPLSLRHEASVGPMACAVTQSHITSTLQPPACLASV